MALLFLFARHGADTLMLMVSQTTGLFARAKCADLCAALCDAAARLQTVRAPKFV